MNQFLQFCKDKAKLNLVVDFILLLLLMAMAGIGFLIKYILLPGVQRNLRYGHDIDLEFWGLDRHQWGSIHLILSITFLALMLLQIILHWKMAVCIFRRMVPGKVWRWTFAVAVKGPDHV